MAGAIPQLTLRSVPSSSSSGLVFRSCSLQLSRLTPPNRVSRLILRCKSATSGSSVSHESSSDEDSGLLQNSTADSLRIGSPIIITESPLALKTADSMPSLKMNTGLIKPGDVGRIVARKPKDVWAVRLATGTYLMDAKYFRPLDI